MKYFVLFIGVICEKRDLGVKCLVSTPPDDFTPTLKYITNELVTCVSIIESDEHVVDDSCALSAANNLLCLTDLAEDAPCPTAPEDCDLVDGGLVSDTLHCEYECTAPTLSCSTTEFPVEIDGDADKIYCFNQEINSCINNIVDDDPRIEYKCPKEDCGYNTDSTDTNYALVFDGSEFTNTYTGPNTNGFDCAKSNTKCTCTDKTLVCDVTAYTDDCPDSDAKCQDGICYDAPPLFDYKFANCTITNEEEEDPDIQYCTDDVKVHFPCGESVQNDCQEQVDGKINCYCDVADETKCTMADAVWELEKCVIKDVKDEAKKMVCEFVCFDDQFENEECKSDDLFDHKYWQCFDDFATVEIVPEDENLKAVKTPATTFESFSGCPEPACPDGYCICDERDVASAFCQSNGDFYVTEMELVEKNSRIDAAEYEFECLSFNEEYSAINIIESDVQKDSECRELLPPTPDVDAECPALCNETDLPKVGFFDCKCDKKIKRSCTG